MFEKLLVFTIFFAFLALVTAQDITDPVIPARPSAQQNLTKCFTCDSPSSCLQPKTEICDQNTANNTRSILAKYFSNVPDVVNPQFECLKIKYTMKRTVQFAVSGCINFGLNPCKLQHKNTTLANASKTCVNCSKSLCNPAGTFSSSLFIILSAMFGLWLLKC